jgi:hypothetical protein
MFVNNQPDRVHDVEAFFTTATPEEQRVIPSALPGEVGSARHRAHF